MSLPPSSTFSTFQFPTIAFRSASALSSAPTVTAKHSATATSVRRILTPVGLLLLALEGEEHHRRLLLRFERGGPVGLLRVEAQDDRVVFEFVNAGQVATLE